MTIPGVQKPHCDPWLLAMRSFQDQHSKRETCDTMPFKLLSEIYVVPLNGQTCVWEIVRSDNTVPEVTKYTHLTNSDLFDSRNSLGSSAESESLKLIVSVMKLCLPICVHVAVSLTICICPGLRASVHAMMLCACVVCLVFIFVCRLFTITSDACACACGLRAYHYLLAALLIIT